MVAEYKNNPWDAEWEPTVTEEEATQRKPVADPWEANWEPVGEEATEPVMDLPDRPGVTGALKSIGAAGLATLKDVSEMGVRTVRAMDAPGKQFELPERIKEALPTGLKVLDYLTDKDLIRKPASKSIEGLELIEETFPEAFAPAKQDAGGVRKALYGGVRAFGPSATGLAATVGLGPAGASLPLVAFGASEFDRYIEEAMEQGKSYKETLPYAVASGAIEGGGEAIADLIGAKIFGLDKALPFLSSASQPIKNVLKTTIAKALKGFIKQYPVEAITESGQGVGEQYLRKLQGIKHEDLKTAAIDPLGATAVLTLMFAGGSYTMNKAYSAAMRQALASKNADVKARLRAVDTITQGLAELDEKNGTSDAAIWNEIATDKVLQGKAIDISKPIEEFKGPEDAQDILTETNADQEAADELRQTFQDGEISLPDLMYIMDNIPPSSAVFKTAKELVAENVNKPNEPVDILEPEAKPEVVEPEALPIEPVPAAGLQVPLPDLAGKSAEESAGVFEAAGPRPLTPEETEAQVQAIHEMEAMERPPARGLIVEETGEPTNVWDAEWEAVEPETAKGISEEIEEEVEEAKPGPAIVAEAEDRESPIKPAPKELEQAEKSEEVQIKDHPIVEFPVSGLTLSEEVPNFKEGADKEGVIEPLAGKYERLGTGPIVVWERLNGKTEVITGRHRLDLARRMGEETIPTQVVKESEGWTASMAMTFDAEANIRSGQGTVKDYANYFKNSEITEKEASGRGLLARLNAQKGWRIGKDATDSLYALYRHGKISQTKTDAIAKAAPGNEEIQNIGITYAANHTAEDTANYLRAMQTILPEATSEQIGMFGDNDAWKIEADKMAKAASRMMRELTEEKAALLAAGKLNKKKFAAFLKKYKIKAGDKKAIQKRIDTLNKEIVEMEKWATDPDIVTKIREAAGLKEQAVEPTLVVQTNHPVYGKQTLEIIEEYGGQYIAKTKKGQIAVVSKDGRTVFFPGLDDSGTPKWVESADNVENARKYLDWRNKVEKARKGEEGPTDAQIEAGNYPKKHVKWNGLDISIENEKGSIRKSKPGHLPKWETKMKHDYGYIHRTEGKDGDQVDVFMGKDTDSDKVYIVNQVNPKTGKFDEHKVMIGFPTEKQARVAYLANYERGWKGIGNIVEMSGDQFKLWLKNGDQTKPATKIGIGHALDFMKGKSTKEQLDKVYQDQVKYLKQHPAITPEERKKKLAEVEEAYQVELKAFGKKPGEITAWEIKAISKDVYNFIYGHEGNKGLSDVAKGAFRVGSYERNLTPVDVRSIMLHVYQGHYDSKAYIKKQLKLLSGFEKILPKMGEGPTPNSNRQSIKVAVENGTISKEVGDVYYAIIDALKGTPTFALQYENIYDDYSFAKNIIRTSDPSAFIHEVGHWAFFNLLTGEQRVEYYRDIYNAPEGTKARMRKYLVLKSGKISDEQTLRVNTMDNLSEYFAEQFRQYVTTRVLPYEKHHTLFNHVIENLRKIYRKLRNKNLIDPKLVPYFEQIAEPREIKYKFDDKDRPYLIQKTQREPTDEEIDSIIDAILDTVTPAELISEESKQHQTVTFTGGLTGAGKSAGMSLPLADNEVVNVDADLIKYIAGWINEASDFHVSSSKIAKRVMNLAIAGGYHTVYDSRLGNYKYAEDHIEQALNEDAEVYVNYTHVSLETSRVRSLLRTIFADKSEKRYVPDDVIIAGENTCLPTFLELYKKYHTTIGVTFDLADNNADIGLNKEIDPIKIITDNEVIDPNLLDNLLKTDYIKSEGGKRREKSEKANIDFLREAENAINERINGRLAQEGFKELEGADRYRAEEPGEQNALKWMAFVPQKATKKPLSSDNKSKATDNLADWIRGQIQSASSVSWQALFQEADKAFGGTQAEGRYTVKDAYDAMELGINKAIFDQAIDPEAERSFAETQIKVLKSISERLPTQSKRTREMVEFQQFSTPPPFAYLVNWVANLTSKDRVLEPSAGTGNIGIFAKNAGATVAVNEYSERRLEILKLLPFDEFYNLDAEQLNNEAAGKPLVPFSPTVILMNPPFSSAGQRGVKNAQVVTNHLDAALNKLEPGGRLVAIVGRGMAEGKPTYQAWWKATKKKYNVRCNIRVNGKEYAKFGTTFDNQLVVIDKTGPTPIANPVTGREERSLRKRKKEIEKDLKYKHGQGMDHAYDMAMNDKTAIPRIEAEINDLESEMVEVLTALAGGTATVTGEMERVEDLLSMVEDIRNDRKAIEPETPEEEDTGEGPDETEDYEPPEKTKILTDEKKRVNRIITLSNYSDEDFKDKLKERLAGEGWVFEKETWTGKDRFLTFKPFKEGKPPKKKLTGKDLLKKLKEKQKKAKAKKKKPTKGGKRGPAPGGKRGGKKSGIDSGIDKLNDLFSFKRLVRRMYFKAKPLDQEKYDLAKNIFWDMWDWAEGNGYDADRYIDEVVAKVGDKGVPYFEKFLEEDFDKGREEEEVTDLDIEIKKKEALGEFSDSLYERYKPQRLIIKGANPHGEKLVESAAMSTVTPPAPKYRPALPKKVLDQKTLSDIQLEGITYAGEAHSQKLPSGERKGFFFGDGTGVGKGREIVGVIWDNWNKGRKKSVWVSQNIDLLNDAKRDFTKAGWDPDKVTKLANYEPIKKKEGTIFMPYGTLRSESKKTGKKRIDQLVEWLGEDFDGVIAFDEAHNMQSAVPVRGNRGTKGVSKQAAAGVELQARLPNARVIYVSATGATEVYNLAYADRLGLWGEGTAFADKNAFIQKISAGGIAAMEVVAQNLKATGNYLARSLSYEGVEYDRLDHNLTKDQKGIYSKLVEGWQIVLQNINAALDDTGVTGINNSGNMVTLNPQAKSNAMTAFWGANQRFFSQILTSMQLPTVIKAIQKDLDNGDCAVVQLTSTLASVQERALTRMRAEGQTLEDLDLTPRDTLIEYVRRSFPTRQYHTVTDPNTGAEISVPVTTKDSKGNDVYVENPEAIKKREKLIKELMRMKVPEGPIDAIINYFGHEMVAEVTSRNKRVIKKMTEKGLVPVEEKWSRAKSGVDVKMFNDDKKRILIFSEAGGTGRSYHASKGIKNQRVRQHYLLQPGWKASAAVQGLGRTHRSNQAQPPHFYLCTTDVKGHKRFVSSIARRLDQLGALTKGMRQTGSQGLFTARDNLESDYAEDALHGLFEDIHLNQSEISVEELYNQTGLQIRAKDGSLLAQLPNTKQFMNRLLSMDLEAQDKMFDAWVERLEAIVQRELENGTLDQGLETLKALKIDKAHEEVVFTDPNSGAEVKYVQLDVTRAAERLDWTAAKAYAQRFFKNEKSGMLWAARAGTMTDQATGGVEDTWQMRNVAYNSSVRTKEAVTSSTHTVKDEGEVQTWTELTNEEARPLWEAAYDDMGATKVEQRHLVVGAILSVWDRLIGHPRIMRVATDKGEQMIGRLIPPRQLQATLRNLGAEGVKIELSAKEAFDHIVDDGWSIELANGWRIERRRISGDDRIEVTNLDYSDYQLYRQYGMIEESIGYNLRYFIPKNQTGVSLLNRIIGYSPIVSAESPGVMSFDLKIVQEAIEQTAQAQARASDKGNDAAVRMFQKELDLLYQKQAELKKNEFELTGEEGTPWEKGEVRAPEKSPDQPKARFPGEKGIPTGIGKKDQVEMFPEEKKGQQDLFGTLPFKVEVAPPTGTPAFKKWFGKSKVVDEKGEPLVVYHGTKEAFDKFSKRKAHDKEGKSLNLGWGRGVFYFASRPGEAGKYARGYRGKEYSSLESGASLLPVYLAIKKPFYVDYHAISIEKQLDYRRYQAARDGYKDTKTDIYWGDYPARKNIRLQELVKQLKKEGYDGIIEGNKTDGFEYAAFEPTQIKSIFNPGKWSPTEGDIMKFDMDVEDIDPAKSEAQSFTDRIIEMANKAAATPQAKEAAKRVKEAQEYFESGEYKKDTFETVKNVLDHLDRSEGWKTERPDTTVIERMIQSPEFYFEKVPAAWGVFNASLERVDDKQAYYNKITGEEEHLLALKNFQKDRPKEYSRLAKLITHADMNKIAHTPETLKAERFSDQAIKAWQSFRQMMNNAFDQLFAEMSKIIEEHEKAGLPLPEVVTYIGDQKVMVNLKVALAKMGEMRGYYAPRTRQAGRFMLVARKKGSNPILEFYDLGSKRFEKVWSKTGLPFPFKMQRRAKELRAKGYTVSKEKSKDMPEDVFEMMGGGTMAMNAMINSALDRAIPDAPPTFEDFGLKTEWQGDDFLVRGTPSKEHNEALKAMGGRWYNREPGEAKAWHFADAQKNMEFRLLRAIAARAGVPGVGETNLLFAHSLATEVANTVKGRGFRSSMIKRAEATGEEVWTGYEEDPLKAASQYVTGLASGLAKRDMAGKMVKAMTGTDIDPDMYADYMDYLKAVKERRIDPERQKNIFHDAKTYMFEMLRNQEFADRVIGLVKGITVLKYLGGRLASPLVNLTALVQSVPAAMNGYAGVRFRDVPKYLVKAMDAYRVYRWGDRSKLDPDVAEMFDTMHEKGWHSAQYNLEALAVLRSKIGGSWEKLLEYSMFLFGATEQLNRIATIAGTFIAQKEQAEGEFFEYANALATSKKTSDRAHGIYGKTTLPYIAQGKNPFAQAGKMFYVFSKFSHTYLQTMYDLGFKENNKKALAYMMTAPAILAGGGSIPLIGPLVMAAFGRLFGDSDEPEESFYQWLEEHMGELVGDFARFGLFGLVGVSLKGSLQIDVARSIPMTIPEALGAPANVFSDIYQGGKSIVKGDVYRGLEKIGPRFTGTAFQGVREYRHGITTRKNVPKYLDGKRMQAGLYDAILRVLTFNPSESAKLKEQKWSQTKLKYKYQDMRSDIYDRLRRHYQTPPDGRSRGEYADIMAEINEYNARVSKRNLSRVQGISQITRRSIEQSLNMKR